VEQQAFPARPARYVRISSTGNTENRYMSITEIEVYGR
jgi:hypothetical protein